ncbi:hypothetical protein SLAV_38935 [Streptomyces lavendulae subsp. lavendulae]|uniref:Uncharacterized protein n=1 Tax=Streptomyces lavendulae subsp. lavendulae TaxID=58340 RepID=A0A2K8PTU6_STRLA|nr:hypothetical protein SLAV_00455 [Streptomyces lavendulae subsp. lavendulae]ATZ29550.1 hypothetical protein SLAV_38935 [Streptomyces lavendulae subsp. lavendulae]
MTEENHRGGFPEEPDRFGVPSTPGNSPSSTPPFGPPTAAAPEHPPTADLPDPVGEPDPAPDAEPKPPGVEISDNRNSQIVVAGRDVTMHSKPPLTVTPIPSAEVEAVGLAWVDAGPEHERVTTAEDARVLLAGPGPALAVVAGAPGMGKRTAGIRALWQMSDARRRSGANPLDLQEVHPDWERPESPDIELMPTQEATGYLLDVASEIDAWKAPGDVAKQLLAHAEKLREVGSYLVVIANEDGWPGEQSGAFDRVQVTARVRPSAHEIAIAHLKALYGKPVCADWLQRPTVGSPGPAAMLLNAGSTPADAVRLAATLAGVEESLKGLETAKSAFQEWRTDVKNVFTATEDKPEDRALLIAALFLDGEDALTVQDAARALLKDNSVGTVREILTGPDLTSRLNKVGVEVVTRKVSLDHKAGYARAVLVHLWHQRADIHKPLLDWLDELITAEAGPSRLQTISDLLVELAIAENDFRAITTIKEWIGKDSRAEHLDLIARVLTRAAEAPALGPQVRSKLLDWAQEPSEPVARVVALVCQGEFAEHYPSQALVRLKHVLGRSDRDKAVQTAEAALCATARAQGQLPRFWAALGKWSAEGRSLAAHRAFLALVDPRKDPWILQVMLSSAEQHPDVKEALIDKWSAALGNSKVDAESRQVLHNWAHAFADGHVELPMIKDILDEVIQRHLGSSPISDLMFGAPGVAYDEAVVSLRKALRMPSQLQPWHRRGSGHAGS